MLKSIFYIVMVWLIWRWLDRIFGRKKRIKTWRESQQTTPGQNNNKKPNDDIIGDYVEFEEVEE